MRFFVEKEDEMTKRDKLMLKVGIYEDLFDPYAETFAKNRWKYAQSHKEYADRKSVV